jgi:hypothetical protein
MKNKIILAFGIVSAFTIKTKAQNNFAMLHSSLGTEYGKASAVDADTNYINGSLFQYTINVNPTGTTNLSAPSPATEIALTKYDKHGNLVWAKSFGGTNTSEAPHGIDCDAANNIYVAGYFGNTANGGSFNANFNPLGGGTVATQGNEDCFVAKYDKNGNYQWAFGLGNIGVRLIFWGVIFKQIIFVI